MIYSFGFLKYFVKFPFPRRRLTYGVSDRKVLLCHEKAAAPSATSSFTSSGNPKVLQGVIREGLGNKLMKFLTKNNLKIIKNGLKNKDKRRIKDKLYTDIKDIY